MKISIKFKKLDRRDEPLPTCPGWFEARLSRYAQLTLLFSMGHCCGFGILKVKDMPANVPADHNFQYGLLIALALIALILGVLTENARLDCDGKPFSNVLEGNMALAASSVGGATIITGLMAQSYSGVLIGAIGVAIGAICYPAYLYLKRRKALKNSKFVVGL